MEFSFVGIAARDFFDHQSRLPPFPRARLHRMVDDHAVLFLRMALLLRNQHQGTDCEIETARHAFRLQRGGFPGGCPTLVCQERDYFGGNPVVDHADAGH